MVKTIPAEPVFEDLPVSSPGLAEAAPTPDLVSRLLSFLGTEVGKPEAVHNIKAVRPIFPARSINEKLDDFGDDLDPEFSPKFSGSSRTFSRVEKKVEKKVEKVEKKAEKTMEDLVEEEARVFAEKPKIAAVVAVREFEKTKVDVEASKTEEWMGHAEIVTRIKRRKDRRA